MALYFGSTRLRQKVTEESGLSPEVVHKVLDTYEAVLQQLLENGSRVRLGELGALVQVTRKATRKRVPHTGQCVDVPARAVVVLRPPQAKMKRPNEEPI